MVRRESREGCQLTPREIIQATVAHRQADTVPYTFAAEESVLQRLDEHYGTLAWREMLTEYLSFPLLVDTRQEEPVDDLHARDAYGSLWRMDKRPWHLDRPALRESTLRGYMFPSVEHFVVPIEREINAACRQIAEDPDHFQVIDMGWGIFEQTWRIRGFEEALMDAISEPAFYEDLVARIGEIYLAMVRACAPVPADAFLFGDDWGDQRGTILGPDRWRDLIRPAWQPIYDEVHRQGKIVMSHSCGSVAEIMGDIVEMGMDVLESVQPEAAGMNPYELKKEWGDQITFWGCLGSQSTIPFGSAAEVRTEIRRLREEMGSGGGYIMAPAKPLQPETPTENAVAIVETFAEANVR